MIAPWLFLRREGFVHIQSADQGDVATEGLERFSNKGELEVTAFLQRTPVPGGGPMGMPYAEESSDGTGRSRCFSERRLSRQHGSEDCLLYTSDAADER